MARPHPPRRHRHAAAAGDRELFGPTEDFAQEALRYYYGDIISRFHDRPATPAEVEAKMAAEDVFTFFLARRGEEVLGCAGLRVLGDVGEATRVHVTSAARGQGLGSRLLETVEREGHRLGLRSLRLDTRSDLVEARRLYARHGFVEVEPFNDDLYADHFFAKLPPDPDDVR